MFVCLFVSVKHQNGLTDRAQIWCGTSNDPRKGLCMLKITKLCVQKFLIFGKSLKMSEKILVNPRTFLFVTVLYCTKRRC